MNGALARLAGAPITWGVCEVPGWGCQLGTERVLRELAGIGLGAVELGPPGFLPNDPAALARTLHRHGLRLAGGFVPAILHRAEHRAAALAGITAAAATLAAAGADVLVLAAELGNGAGYDRSAELTGPEWATLLEGLDRSREVAGRHGVRLVLHPHYGTAVERREQVERVVVESDVPLCVDTGHLLVGGADPLEVLRAAGARVTHVHFKDVDAALAARVRAGELGYREAVGRGLYRPLGDGDVDVAGMVRLLRSAGYQGWYVLEQDVVLDAEPKEGEGPVRSAARSVDYFKGLVQG
ncbi:MAG TPA: TIM barrel protein [Gemmatimonadales bacterium]|nr:TIM barrel protein [Gemmatimonadales bacterium]